MTNAKRRKMMFSASFTDFDDFSLALRGTRGPSIKTVYYLLPWFPPIRTVNQSGLEVTIQAFPHDL